MGGHNSGFHFIEELSQEVVQLTSRLLKKEQRGLRVQKNGWPSLSIGHEKLYINIIFSNGNVIDDLLLLNGGANHDSGGAVVVKDDNSTAAAATAFPTHHTIIVPAPMDVRRDRNSRSKFLESSDEEDGSGRDDAAGDDNENYNEKRGGGGSSRDLLT